ncbi:hypothetical protein [Parahaliea mediterranea]|uniref:Uncharacterized protein n=1 Tax=Parahaliea mediterranea TaxID=651086 RepID=A0A939DE02_9GAMM|nr:hypothetical protein [Parahaliea mediterranea]MBN7796520.1 hypothetical protein [Parahaliea mediterranea]
MYAWLGVVLGASGVLGLYSSWRRLALSGGRVVALSWLLIAASPWAWSRAWGAEFGISFALIALSLLGGLLVLFNFEVRERKQSRPASTQAVAVDPRSWGRHLFLFFVVVPLAGAASIFSTVLLCGLLPWHPTDKMVLAVLLVPVVWGLAAYWACADTRPARPAAALLCAATLPALMLLL